MAETQKIIDWKRNEAIRLAKEWGVKACDVACHSISRRIADKTTLEDNMKVCYAFNRHFLFQHDPIIPKPQNKIEAGHL